MTCTNETFAMHYDEYEEIDHDDIDAASDMLDSLENGTFYQNQESTAKELGITIKYIS